MSVNKVFLLGNVGQDPEIRSTNDGKEIANFSIATTETWKDKEGNRKTKTEWHKVVIFQQGLVDTVKKWVKKGSKLHIEGQIQTRKWTDNNGVEKYSTEIVLNSFNSSMKIIHRIDARLFEGVCVYLLGRFALLRGDRSHARQLTQRGISILHESESGMTFGGPIALGILALAAEDEAQCRAALAEAEAILDEGSVGHNYLNFYEDAMEACLQFGAW